MKWWGDMKHLTKIFHDIKASQHSMANKISYLDEKLTIIDTKISAQGESQNTDQRINNLFIGGTFLVGLTALYYQVILPDLQITRSTNNQSQARS